MYLNSISAISSPFSFNILCLFGCTRLGSSERILPELNRKWEIKCIRGNNQRWENFQLKTMCGAGQIAIEVKSSLLCALLIELHNKKWIVLLISQLNWPVLSQWKPLILFGRFSQHWSLLECGPINCGHSSKPAGIGLGKSCFHREILLSRVSWRTIPNSPAGNF